MSLAARLNPIAFDFETTGKDPKSARIWEAAFVGEDSADTLLINPGCEISEEIQKLCHLEPEDLQKIAQSPVWSKQQDKILELIDSADSLVGHNVHRYDVPCLMAHCEPFKPTLPPVFDTRVLSVEVWPNMPNHKLGTLAQALKICSAEDLESGAHGAEFDCKVTRLIWKKIIQEIQGATVAGLQVFQEDAVRLQAYDWKMFGIVPEDGPRFLWFRTCRWCGGTFQPKVRKPCSRCNGYGIIHMTKARRGQAVDANWLNWMERNVDPLPAWFSLTIKQIQALDDTRPTLPDPCAQDEKALYGDDSNDLPYDPEFPHDDDIPF